MIKLAVGYVTKISEILLNNPAWLNVTAGGLSVRAGGLTVTTVVGQLYG